MANNSKQNQDKGLLDLATKAGGWVLGGAFAVATGVLKGIADTLDSVTDL